MPTSPFESPETLVYIGGGSTKPFFGPVTLRRYVAGDGVSPFVTVEAKDVELMLKKSRNGAPLFRRPTAEELAELGQVEAAAALVATDETEGEKPVDYAFIFQSFEGIGEATAKKLVAAGFTTESLAEGQDEAVAKSASISLALAQAAIAGAKKLLETPSIPPASTGEGEEPKE